MEDLIVWVVGIVVVLLVIKLAIDYWPITLTIIICIILYFVNRKKAKVSCEGDIAACREKINKSEGLIDELQKRLQANEQRANTTEKQLQATRDRKRVVTKDVAFFSALFKSDSISMPKCMNNLERSINELEHTRTTILNETSKLRQEISNESQILSGYNSSLSELRSELEDLTRKK